MTAGGSFALFETAVGTCAIAWTPCHRVVAAHGRMGGFSAPGGVQTKRHLLALERAAGWLDFGIPDGGAAHAGRAACTGTDLPILYRRS